MLIHRNKNGTMQYTSSVLLKLQLMSSQAPTIYILHYILIYIFRCIYTSLLLSH